MAGMTAAERVPIINRIRRKLKHAPNKSTALKIMGSELIVLYDQLDDDRKLIDEANQRADDAEEREATAVRRQAEAEALAADTLAGNVAVPEKGARGRTKTVEVEVVPPVYPAILRACDQINREFSECWESPLPVALKTWVDYGEGELPEGWETVVGDALA